MDAPSLELGVQHYLDLAMVDDCTITWSWGITLVVGALEANKKSGSPVSLKRRKGNSAVGAEQADFLFLLEYSEAQGAFCSCKSLASKGK